MQVPTKYLMSLVLTLVFGFISQAQEQKSFKIPLKKFDYSKVISVSDTAVFFMTSDRLSENNFSNRFYCFSKKNHVTEMLSEVKGNFNCLTDCNFFLNDIAFFTDFYSGDSRSSKRLNVICTSPFKGKSLVKKETIFEEKNIKEKKEEIKKAVWLKPQLGFYKQNEIFVGHRKKELDSFYEIEYKTLDASGMVSGLNEINLPYKNSECAVTDIFFDDKQGELYFLLRVSVTELQNNKSGSYALVKYNLNSKTTTEKRIELSAKKFKTHFQLVGENMFLLFFPREKTTTITDTVNLVVFNRGNLEIIGQSKLGFPSKVADDLLSETGSLFFKCVSYCQLKNKSYFLFENGINSDDKELGFDDYFAPYLSGSGSVGGAIALSIVDANNFSFTDASAIIEVDSSYNMQMQAYFKFSKLHAELHSYLYSSKNELILMSNIKDKEKMYKQTFPVWEIATDSLRLTKAKFMDTKKMLEDKYYPSSTFETRTEIYFLGKSKIEDYDKFESYIYTITKQ